MKTDGYESQGGMTNGEEGRKGDKRENIEKIIEG